MSDSTIPQSNSSIKREARIKNKSSKKFAGKMENFKDNQERHFYQRMLRAYLKGWQYFDFGFEYTPTGRRPKQHEVMVSY